jgi:putative tricarboxylic transport membrane protein
MRRAQQIAGLALLALALFLGWQAAQLSYYSPLGPGPGFFPLWLCILLGILSVAALVNSLRGTPPELATPFWPDRTALVRIGTVIAGLAFVAAAMSTLGFPLTMLVFYGVLAFVLGSRKPVEIVGTALLGSFGVYYAFTRYLSQPLPAGVLGN